MDKYNEHFVFVHPYCCETSEESEQIVVSVAKNLEDESFMAFLSSAEMGISNIFTYNLRPEQIVRDIGAMDEVYSSPELRPVLDAISAIKLDISNQNLLIGMADILYRNQSQLSEPEIKAAYKKLRNAYFENEERQSRISNALARSLEIDGVADAAGDDGNKAIDPHMLLQLDRKIKKADDWALNLKDYQDAEPIYADCVRLSEEIYGRRHVKTAELLFKQGYCLNKLRKPDEAIQCLRESVETFNQSSSPDTSIFIPALNLLGELLREKEIYEESERVLRQSLSLCEQTYDQGSFDIEVAKFRLGKTLLDADKTDQAEVILRQFVPTAEAHLGRNHPLTIEAIHKLAELALQKHAYEEALNLFREVLGNYIQCYGQNAYITIDVNRCIAVCLRELGQYEESLATFQQVLDACIAQYSKTDDYTLFVFSGAGKLYRMMGNIIKAKEILEDALETARSHLKADHWVVEGIENELALLNS